MCVNFAFGFRFRSLQPGAIPVIESVKARVKFHLTVFFKHQRIAIFILSVYSLVLVFCTFVPLMSSFSCV